MSSCLFACFTMTPETFDRCVNLETRNVMLLLQMALTRVLSRLVRVTPVVSPVCLLLSTVRACGSLMNREMSLL